MRSPAESAERLTIGRIAEMAHVSANAVRFYEREGLLQATAKTAATGCTT